MPGTAQLHVEVAVLLSICNQACHRTSMENIRMSDSWLKPRINQTLTESRDLYSKMKVMTY